MAHTEPLTYHLAKDYSWYMQNVIKALSCVSKGGEENKQKSGEVSQIAK